MRKNRAPGILRRVEAAALALGVLWAAAVTAGSGSAPAALQALGRAAPLGVLRWELGDLWSGDQLSPAAVLALSQAPLLLSAREEVTALWRQEESSGGGMPETETEAIPEPAPASPVEETPLDVPAQAETVDNGVPARTLVPTDLSGYTVYGRCCISNSTDHELSFQALGSPSPPGWARRSRRS